MSVLKLTGKTFENREAIKALGGKWNADEKAWFLSDMTAGNDVAELAANGVVIAPITEKKPEPIVQKPIESVREGDTVYFGNSRQHETMFDAASNPHSFAGFDSFGAMVDFVESIPIQKPDHAWNDDFEFRATRSMTEAISIARTGWPEGLEMAQRVLERLTARQAQRRRHRNALVGGHVNVGRMMSGNPVHMRARVKQPADKIVTLVNNGGFRAVNEIEDIQIRAAVIAAVADALEDNGYSCEIINANYNLIDSKKVSVVTTLKKAGEKFNISDLMFAMGHPSYHRRFNFAIFALTGAEYMGRSHDVFRNAESVPNNVFFMKRIHQSFQNIGRTFDEKVDAIVKHIVPDNLPIEWS